MVKMQEKRNQPPTQNIQMMNAKKRTDEPCINIVTRSRVVTESDKADGKKEFENIGAWVRKTIEKVHITDVHKENKDFIVVKQIFMDVGASTSTTHPGPSNCDMSFVLTQNQAMTQYQALQHNLADQVSNLR